MPHLLNELVNSEIDYQSRKLSSAVLSVLQWRREVAFAGFEVPIQMDVSAEKMIFGVTGTDPQRRDELIKVRIKMNNCYLRGIYKSPMGPLLC